MKNLSDVTEHFRKRGYPGCGVCGGKFHITDMWIDAELYYEHGQWVIELQCVLNSITNTDNGSLNCSVTSLLIHSIMMTLKKPLSILTENFTIIRRTNENDLL